MRRAARVSLYALLCLSLLALGLTLLASLALRASLPVLDGERPLSGLAAPVSVQRDAAGTVTIEAAGEADAMRALGFIHAQERYFEMDLLRRSAAGELAALFGERALERDLELRRHRMRARSHDFMRRLPADQRELLEAYAAGVNSGLDALSVRPWAYLVLRRPPQAWQPEDALLVGYALFFDLQDSSNRRELALLQMRRHLPEALVAALAADGSEWDAPLQGGARPALSAQRLQALAELRGRTTPGADTGNGPYGYEPGEVPGSNNFAIDGSLSQDGRALVADDMHLGLRAPNVWFRARLRYPHPQAPDGRVDVSGVSLPGTPGIVVGSNGHVAWGFTNSYGDWHDFIRVHWTDAGRERYRTPEGDEAVQVITETIEVGGGVPVELRILETRWGPVVHEYGDGSSLALAWTAHRFGSLDLGLVGLGRAADLEQAIAIANRSGTPPQNFVAGDSSGRIGWTLLGRIPHRTGGCDPLQPLDPVLEGCDWQGWLPPERSPRLLDPGSGRLWTANSRVVDGEDLALIGDGGYDLGARQRQIRDRLQAIERFDEATLLDIQLDARALFLQRWWQLLREAIQTDAGASPALAALEPVTRRWEGEAAADAVAYRLTRGFRGKVLEYLVDDLLAPVAAAEGEDFVAPRLAQVEGLLWPVASSRLPAWLPERFQDWDELFASAAQELVDELGQEPDGLGERSWGERNTARIRHPLASALPGPLARRLSMPADPLPGDSNLPRAQGPGFGASQRMVVAPGREHEGILHMPGGQSGHPLSPFWGAGHQDWVEGRASPFLPGETRHRLVLSPKAGQFSPGS